MKQGLKNVLKNTLLIRKTSLQFFPTMIQKENNKNKSMKKKYYSEDPTVLNTGIYKF